MGDWVFKGEMMALPTKRNNIMSFGDRILYYMSQSYAVQATASPPANEESWYALEERLAYYMTRGWTFT